MTEQKPKLDVESEEQVHHLPLYRVLLHNDDVNNMGHMVKTLQEVFHFDQGKAQTIMLEGGHSGDGEGGERMTTLLSAPLLPFRRQYASRLWAVFGNQVMSTAHSATVTGLTSPPEGKEQSGHPEQHHRNKECRVNRDSCDATGNGANEKQASCTSHSWLCRLHGPGVVTLRAEHDCRLPTDALICTDAMIFGNDTITPKQINSAVGVLAMVKA